MEFFICKCKIEIQGLEKEFNEKQKIKTYINENG